MYLLDLIDVRQMQLELWAKGVLDVDGLGGQEHWLPFRFELVGGVEELRVDE